MSGRGRGYRRGWGIRNQEESVGARGEAAVRGRVAHGPAGPVGMCRCHRRTAHAARCAMLRLAAPAARQSDHPGNLTSTGPPTRCCMRLGRTVPAPACKVQVGWPIGPPKAKARSWTASTLPIQALQRVGPVLCFLFQAAGAGTGAGAGEVALAPPPSLSSSSSGVVSGIDVSLAGMSTLSTT